MSAPPADNRHPVYDMALWVRQSNWPLDSAFNFYSRRHPIRIWRISFQGIENRARSEFLANQRKSPRWPPNICSGLPKTFILPAQPQSRSPLMITLCFFILIAVTP